jgi:phosphatidylglycerophosphatase A
MTEYPAQRVVASSFGMGLIPRRIWGTDSGAGTFGAALAWVAALLLLDASWVVLALLAAAATAASVWAAAPFSADHDDPGWICMDETAGTLLALIGLAGWPLLVAAVVARLADIFKVLPGVRAAERLPGGWGITADDLVAGAYGLAAGWAVQLLL